MAKNFNQFIEDGSVACERNEESIAKEEALDGIYVFRTSEPKEVLSAADTVHTYKSLSRVERLFRTLKGATCGSARSAIAPRKFQAVDFFT